MHHHERRLKPRGDDKVLVIEDEPTILFAFEETIRKKGFEFISARDGKEGLAKAKELIPALIITDVGLLDSEEHYGHVSYPHYYCDRPHSKEGS